MLAGKDWKDFQSCSFLKSHYFPANNLNLWHTAHATVAVHCMQLFLLCTRYGITPLYINSGNKAAIRSFLVQQRVILPMKGKVVLASKDLEIGSLGRKYSTMVAAAQCAQPTIINYRPTENALQKPQIKHVHIPTVQCCGT
jgi:hypothetical protein